MNRTPYFLIIYNMVEEVEIKIEYFDSNEIDPLKEYKNQESKKNPTLQNDEVIYLIIKSFTVRPQV